eukprot:gene16624-19750_t
MQPEDARAYFLRADVYLEDKLYQEAINDLRVVYDLIHDTQKVLETLGNIEKHEKNTTLAMSYFKKALEINPRNLYSMVRMGELAMDQSDDDAATKPEGTDTPFIKACTLLGYIHHQKEMNIPKALEVIDMGLAVDPTYEPLLESKKLCLETLANLETIQAKQDEASEDERILLALTLCQSDRYTESIAIYRSIIAAVVARNLPEEAVHRVGLQYMLFKPCSQRSIMASQAVTVKRAFYLENSNRKELDALLTHKPTDLLDLSRCAKALSSFFKSMKVLPTDDPIDYGKRREALDADIDALDQVSITAEQSHQLQTATNLELEPQVKEVLCNMFRNVTKWRHKATGAMGSFQPHCFGAREIKYLAHPLSAELLTSNTLIITINLQAELDNQHSGSEEYRADLTHRLFMSNRLAERYEDAIKDLEVVKELVQEASQLDMFLLLANPQDLYKMNGSCCFESYKIKNEQFELYMNSNPTPSKANEAIRAIDKDMYLLETAILCFNKALESDPKDVDCDDIKALEFIDTALQLDPTYEKAIHKRSTIAKRIHARGLLMTELANQHTGSEGYRTDLARRLVMSNLPIESIPIYESLAKAMMERNLPEEAAKRVQLLQLMVMPYFLRVDKIDFKGKITVPQHYNGEEFMSLVNMRPTTFQELSDCAYEVSEIFKITSIHCGPEHQESLVARIELLLLLSNIAKESQQLHNNSSNVDPKIMEDINKKTEIVTYANNLNVFTELKLTELIKMKPDDPRAYYHRACVYQWRKRYEEAIKDLDIVKALIQDTTKHEVFSQLPTSKDLYYLYGQCYYELYKVKREEDRSRRTNTLISMTVEVADAIHRTEIFRDSAVSYFKMDLERNPGNVEPGAGLKASKAFCHLGDNHKAMEVIDSLLQFDPTNAAAIKEKEIIHERMCRDDQLMAELDSQHKGSEQDTKDLAYQLFNNGRRAEAMTIYKSMVKSILDRNLPEEADKRVNQESLQSFFKHKPTTLLELSDSAYKISEIFKLTAKLGGQEHQESLEANIDFLLILSITAKQCHEVLNSPILKTFDPEIIQEINEKQSGFFSYSFANAVRSALGPLDSTKFVEIKSDDPRSYYLRAKAHCMEEYYEEAIKDLDIVKELIKDASKLKLLNEISNLKELYYMRGQCYYQLYKVLEEKTSRHLKNSNSISVQSMDIVTKAFKLLESAKTCFMMGLERDPKDVQSLCALGELAIIMGDHVSCPEYYVEAITIMKEKGPEKFPELFKSACANSTTSLAERGENDKALDMTNTLLQFDPTNVQAIKNKEILKERIDLLALYKAQAESQHTGSEEDRDDMANHLYNLGLMTESLAIYDPLAKSMLERNLPEEAVKRVLMLQRMTKLYALRTMRLELSGDISNYAAERLEWFKNNQPATLQELSEDAYEVSQILQHYYNPRDKESLDVRVDTTTIKSYEDGLSEAEELLNIDTAKATIELSKLIEMKVDDPRAYYLRAFACHLESRYLDAVSDLEVINKLLRDTDNSIIFTRKPPRLTLLARQKLKIFGIWNSRSFDVAYYKMEFERCPDEVELVIFLGDIAMEQREFHVAQEYFLEVITLCNERGPELHSMTLAQAYLKYGIVLSLQGDYVKALETIDTLLQFDPDNQSAIKCKDEEHRADLAHLLFLKNRHKESIAIYKSLATSILERDQPDEATKRVQFFQMMLLPYTAICMNEQYRGDLRMPGYYTQEKAMSLINIKPATLQEISDCSYDWSQVLKFSSTTESEEYKESLERLIELFLLMSLLAKQSHQLLNSPIIETVDAKIKEDIIMKNEMIYIFYDMFTNSIKIQ